MTTTLIIARHGNTFNLDQIPTRVGARTDLPLVESGEEQALRLGYHLKSQHIIPDLVFTSNLRRTIDTARLACVAMMCPAPNSQLTFLNEIDYGKDENMHESDVIARHGDLTLKRWDELGEMPDGWSPRPDVIINSWKFFLDGCAKEHNNKTILLITSNGIARFALKHTENGDTIPMKLSTGAYGILKYNQKWTVTDWNIRP
jgi:2,3-bisphosphoglycerate-dependent phosphoglycerate mutase